MSVLSVLLTKFYEKQKQKQTTLYDFLLVVTGVKGKLSNGFLKRLLSHSSVNMMAAV